MWRFTSTNLFQFFFLFLRFLLCRFGILSNDHVTCKLVNVFHWVHLTQESNVSLFLSNAWSNKISTYHVTPSSALHATTIVTTQYVYGRKEIHCCCPSFNTLNKSQYLVSCALRSHIEEKFTEKKKSILTSFFSLWLSFPSYYYLFRFGVHIFLFLTHFTWLHLIFIQW